MFKMDIKTAREIYSEPTVRLLFNLCPGCGADNMPPVFSWLTGKALRICPKCGADRTPPDMEGYNE